MKRKLAIFLGISLMAISFTACNSCNQDPNETNNNTATCTDGTCSQDPNETMAGESLLQWGTIVSIDKENTHMLIQSKNIQMEQENASLDKLILNFSADKTAFIDAATGKKVMLDDLKEGDEIYAWVSVAFTSSEPAQTFAYAIATNISDATPIEYVGVASVDKKDNHVVLTDKTDVKWDLTDVPSANITNYADGKEVDPTTLKADSTCLIWPAKIAVDEKMEDNTLKAERVLVVE